MAIVGYEYRERLNGETEWNPVIDLGPQLDLTEVTSGWAAASTHDFQVRGYDPEGIRTDWSNIATASTLGVGALPEFIGASDEDGNVGGDVSFELPEGVSEGDLMIAFIETADEEVTIDGWEEAEDSPVRNLGGNPTRLTVLYKRAGASEPNPVTSGVTDHVVGGVLVYRGCAPSGDPFNVTNSGDIGNATDAQINSVTTTIDNCVILAAIADSRDENSNDIHTFTNSNLTDLTRRLGFNTASGAGGGIAVASGDLAAAGPTGITEVTIGIPIDYAGWCGALKPA
jgi:hypothetical protein